MQEVLENAQKQAKEDKSKHLQKKRSTQEKVVEKLPEVVVTETMKNSEVEAITSIDNKHQSTIELKDKVITSNSPEVDLLTSPTKNDRLKLLTPSKFRCQIASIGTQTDMLVENIKLPFFNFFFLYLANVQLTTIYTLQEIKVYEYNLSEIK